MVAQSDAEDTQSHAEGAGSFENTAPSVLLSGRLFAPRLCGHIAHELARHSLIKRAAARRLLRESYGLSCLSGKARQVWGDVGMTPPLAATSRWMNEYP